MEGDVRRFPARAGGGFRWFRRFRAGKFAPFDPVRDYDDYVDGKPRLEGTRAFLASRGIKLPDGTPDDPPGTDTLCGLGNRKNELFQQVLERDGVDVYDGSRRYLAAVRAAGLRTALVSSSANTAQVVERGGVADQFDVTVDGHVTEAKGLHGKPAPDTYLAAAQMLGVEPGAAAVFEDALAGVEAGRAGKFGIVVGVDRVGQAAQLREHGADIVVKDLGDLLRLDVLRGPAREAAPVIVNAPYGIEPWTLTESHLDLDLLAQSESVFALSNGHIGLRGNLDEGEPSGLPGTYLNSVYEERPLPYAEAGYGYPEIGQTVINVTNGKIIRLLVDDEPFDIRYGTLGSHVRTLDLRAGTLTRHVEWTSPAGRRVKVSSVRLVSLTQRAVAAICYTVTPLDEPARLVLSPSWWRTRTCPERPATPRAASVLAHPLVPEVHASVGGDDLRAALVHHTRASGLRIAAAMSHDGHRPERRTVRTEALPDLARVIVAAEVGAGESIRLVKYLGYGWSSAAVPPGAGRPGKRALLPRPS